MKKLKLLGVIVSVSLLITAIFATIANAAAAPAIDWFVVAGGGGHVESTGGTFVVDSTIGQPIAGEAGEGLCSGFWCIVSEWIADLHIYLPLIIKD